MSLAACLTTFSIRVNMPRRSTRAAAHFFSLQPEFRGATWCRADPGAC
jgi:hypothetical protein